MTLVHLCSFVFVSAITFADDEGFQRPNMALHKPATQSSSSEFYSAATHAVDGRATGIFNERSCSHTAFYKTGTVWWEVDLQKSHSIDTVRIFNRADTVAYRLHDFKIEVFEKKTQPRGKKHCATHDGPAGEGWTTVSCETTVRGRFVRIAKPQTKFDDVLTLCEVEVYGPRRPNIALHKPASQEQTFSRAGLAVDGRADDVFDHGSCSHTGFGNPSIAWWEVDLQKDYIVDTVWMLNRGQNLAFKLHDLKIDVFGKKTEPRGKKHCATHDGPAGEGWSSMKCDTPVIGRYVRITKRKTDYEDVLTLCEVQIYGEERPNFALHKPAIQSSRYKNRGPAELAVDGRADDIFDHGSCSHTGYELAMVWWEVDLQNSYHIDTVRIFNRGEKISFRLHDFKIDVFRKVTEPRWARHCASHDGTAGEGWLNMKCETPVIGRHVRITKPMNDLDDALCLCEVEIYGQERPNIALHKPSIQSSTHMNGSAGKAVDGGADGIFDHGSCSHTRADSPEGRAWWEVDLQRSYRIDIVRIFSRAENKTFRLHDFKIEVFRKEMEPRGQKFCATHVGPAGEGWLTVECETPVNGRHVRITKPKADGEDVLSLCEVEIYGFERPNIALHKPAIQSSDLVTGQNRNSTAGRAVDGLADGVFTHGSCSHSGLDFPNNTTWWEVDLQKIYRVDTVRIFNRAGNLAFRLHDLKIDVFGQQTMPRRMRHCATHNGSAEGWLTVECETPVIGRHVRITRFQTNGEDALTLCEVEIYGEERPNFALHKPAIQSSNYGTTGLAKLAVDGRADDIFDHGSCSQTGYELAMVWWEVDLQNSYRIDTVMIFNRGENTSFRLHDFNIDVFRKVTEPRWAKHCASHDGPAGEGWLSINCEPPVIGRHVRISKPTTDFDDVLSLCEVEIYGQERPNIALHKPSIQSSTHMNGSAGKAVDGGADGIFDHGSCSHTRADSPEGRAWWEVDLQRSYRIDIVRIFNRAENKTFRLHDLKIDVFGQQTVPRRIRHCATHNGSAEGWLTVECETPVIGRHVRITKFQTNGEDALTLCEVEIYGTVIFRYRYFGEETNVASSQNQELTTRSTLDCGATCLSSTICNGVRVEGTEEDRFCHIHTTVPKESRNLEGTKHSSYIPLWEQGGEI